MQSFWRCSSQRTHSSTTRCFPENKRPPLIRRRARTRSRERERSLEKSDEWSPVAREEGLLKQEEVGEEGRGLGGKDRDYLEIEFWTIKARRLSLVGLCQQVARDCHRRCGA